MYLQRVLYIFFCLLMLTACMNNQNENSLEPSGNRDLELVKLSSHGTTDQQPSNQAKEIISNYEEVSGVRAVNYDNELLIAVEVEHHERFALDKIESDLRKKIKQNFSEMKVTLSTDQKIFIELRQLEEDFLANDISEKQLQKRIKKLINLSKEKT